MQRVFDSKTKEELLRIKLTRMSVSMGDDIAAPHQEEFLLPIGCTISDLILKILNSTYLPKIAGGKATWLVRRGNEILAIIAQEWAAPRFILNELSSCLLLREADGMVYIKVDYLAQLNPEEAYKKYSC